MVTSWPWGFPHGLRSLVKAEVQSGLSDLSRWVTNDLLRVAEHWANSGPASLTSAHHWTIFVSGVGGDVDWRHSWVHDCHTRSRWHAAKAQPETPRQYKLPEASLCQQCLFPASLSVLAAVNHLTWWELLSVFCYCKCAAGLVCSLGPKGSICLLNVSSYCLLDLYGSWAPYLLC